MSIRHLHLRADFPEKINQLYLGKKKHQKYNIYRRHLVDWASIE